MEIEQTNRLRAVSNGVLVAALTMIVAGCGAILAMSWQVARGIDPVVGRETLRQVHQIAWLAAAMLALALLLTAWALMRFLGRRIEGTHLGKPTAYVDAWSAAGKRIQLADDDEEDEDEQK